MSREVVNQSTGSPRGGGALDSLLNAAGRVDSAPEALNAVAAELGFLAEREVSLRASFLKAAPAYIFGFKSLKGVFRSRRHEVLGRSSARLLFIAQHAGAGLASLQPLIDKSEERGVSTAVVATGNVLDTHSGIIRSSSVFGLDGMALRQVLFPSRLVRSEASLVADLLQEVYPGSRYLRRYVKHLVSKYHAYRFCLRKIMLRSQTEVVVNHADFTVAGRAAISVARELGLREVVVQHGFPSREYFPVYSDDYVLWGPEFKALFEARGTDSSRLHVIGAPRLDYLSHLGLEMRLKSRQSARQRWGMGNQKVVLFLSHSHSPAPAGFHERVREMLVAGAAASSSTSWLVRPHPQEGLASWTQVCRASALRLAEPSSLVEALCGADLVVSPFSSSLLEALLLDRPAVQLIPQGFTDVPVYVEKQAVAETLLDLKRLVEEEPPVASASQGSAAKWVVNAGSGTAEVMSHLLRSVA